MKNGTHHIKKGKVRKAYEILGGNVWKITPH